MGIRTNCPNGHRLNLKAFLAGRRGICPYCGASFLIPTQSTRGKSARAAEQATQPETPTEAPAMPGPASPVAIMPGSVATVPTDLGHAAAPVVDPMLGMGASMPKGPPPLPAGGYAAPVQPMPEAAGPAPASPAATMAAGPIFPEGGPGIIVQPTGYAGAAQPAPAVALFRDATESGPAPIVSAPVGLSASEPPPAPQGTPAAPDALSEAPNAVWYVRPAAGGQFGPANADIMRTWLKEGRIGTDSLVWREGWRDWRDAAGVFPQLSPDPGVAVGVLGTDPTGVNPGRHTPVRRQSGGTGVLLIALLFLAVVVLFVVLFWILLHQQGGRTEPAANGTPRATAVFDGPTGWKPWQAS